MRIIKEAFLVQAAQDYPKAASYLDRWRAVVRAAEWRNVVELRRTYPGTDFAEVKSGRRVLVFNVCGNQFRLIAAVHFNAQIVYALRFMTHAEYSKDRWKDIL